MEEESSSNIALMEVVISKSKQASILWLEGFREACCLHRVVMLSLRSRKLLIRTGQCFLLNGFIYLGSIFVLNSVVIPTLQWILPDHCSQITGQKLCPYGDSLKFYYVLREGLIQIFYVFWLCPLYVLSYILSTIWYNDIAKYGFIAMGTSGPAEAARSEKLPSQNTAQMEKPAGLGGVMIGIGEQVYSALLMCFFFLEVLVSGYIPFIGKMLNFLLLSWMYAYYCFEYKWNLSEVPLNKRLDFFESSWAFFAGFGSPCVLAIFFFSPFVSYGVMAILYPLFVLTATCSGAEQLVFSQTRKWGGPGLGRLPIFHAADTLSLWALSFISLEPRVTIDDKKAL